MFIVHTQGEAHTSACLAKDINVRAAIAMNELSFVCSCHQGGKKHHRNEFLQKAHSQVATLVQCSSGGVATLLTTYISIHTQEVLSATTPLATHTHTTHSHICTHWSLPQAKIKSPKLANSTLSACVGRRKRVGLQLLFAYVCVYMYAGTYVSVCVCL